MKAFGIVLLLLFSNCASFMLSTGTNAFEQATRYPRMAQVTNTRLRQYQKIDCLEYSVDLDLNGHVDVRLIYLVGKPSENDEGVSRSRFPYVFIWIDENTGESYAQQFDLDIDGSIDSISGDIHRLNRVLDRINQ